jgi:hypothetical protein
LLMQGKSGSAVLPILPLADNFLIIVNNHNIYIVKLLLVTLWYY